MESIKPSKIKTSMLFHLDLGNSTILSCLLFFFLIIELSYLINAVIFNPIAELVIPIGIPSKEGRN